MSKCVGICLFYILCAGLKFILTESAIESTDIVEETLSFVKYAQTQLKVEKNADIIFVIGNTGGGTSTLVHYLIDDKKLTSFDDGDPYQYAVRDELDRDVNVKTSLSVSRTLIPEANVDHEHNVFIDMPGFRDTRNETIEIATNLLMKNILQSASRMKLILTLNHAGVESSRVDFDKLLSRTVQLIRNVKQFENGTSLVLTKIPEPKNSKSREDENKRTKRNVVHFFREHAQFLREKGTPESAKKVELIKSLLKQSSDGDYPRISLFPRPNIEGRFDEIPKMVESRRLIRKSILEDTSFVEIHGSTFGYALSAEAQLKVATLIRYTGNGIAKTLNDLTGHLQDELGRQMKSPLSFKKKLELIELSGKVFELNIEVNELTLNQLIEKFKRFLGETDGLFLKQIDEIKQHEHNLKVFKSLLEKQVDSPKINLMSVINQMVTFVKKLENEVQNEIQNQAQQLIHSIGVNLTNIDNRMLARLREKVQSTNGCPGKLEILKIEKNCSRSGSASEQLTLKQKIDQLKRLAASLNAASIDQSELNRIENRVQQLVELKSMARSDISMPIHEWIATSSKAIDYQCSEYDWYNFMVQIYSTLESPESQRNFTVTMDSFNAFTKRISPEADFQATQSRVDDLNEMIKTLLKLPPQYKCSNETMTITGVSLRSSDIQLSKCSSIAVKKINVHAVDTFDVDTDLHLSEAEAVELHILASTWKVRKAVTFHLNGTDGAWQAPSSSDGIAGRPGNPGKNGKNFFGMAKNVVDGHLLTVITSGGNGGNGQDGTGSPDVNIQFDQSDDVAKKLSPKQTPPHLSDVMHRRSSDAQVATTTAYLGAKNCFWARYCDLSFIIYPKQCCGQTGAGGVGGRGGFAGYSQFRQIGSSSTNLPKTIAKPGTDGQHGRDGRQCESKALRVDTYSERVMVRSPVDWNVVTSFSVSTINNSQCIGKGAINSCDQSVQQPNPPKQLNNAASLNDYKQFLNQNLQNPMLVEIIQDTVKSIDISGNN